MDQPEKIKFLKTIGYSSFSEIQALSESEQKHLLSHLMEKDKSGYIVEEFKNGSNLAGYTVSRPRVITSKSTTRDIGFGFKGLRDA